MERGKLIISSIKAEFKLLKRKKKNNLFSAVSEHSWKKRL